MYTYEDNVVYVECSLKVAIQMAQDHARLTPDGDTQLSFIILWPDE